MMAMVQRAAKDEMNTETEQLKMEIKRLNEQLKQQKDQDKGSSVKQKNAVANSGTKKVKIEIHWCSSHRQILQFMLQH